jgi:hypothetical protein
MTKIKRIVVYKSNTGFTEKYARWIAEDLCCDAVRLEQISASKMSQYDVVIFGGGIHAGTINGIRYIKNNISTIKSKKIIVFATGATPAIPEEIERFRKANIPCGEDIEFFYFQSGMNYAQMHGTDKMLMGMLKTFLKIKKNKSDVEKGTADAIQNSYDYSNRNQLAPLIDYVNAIKFAQQV